MGKNNSFGHMKNFKHTQWSNLHTQKENSHEKENKNNKTYNIGHEKLEVSPG